MNWNKSDVIPESGRKVVAISWHWKKVWPASMEMMGGTVMYHPHSSDEWKEWRVETMDDSGAGSYAKDGEDVDYWIYAEEFAYDFLPAEIKEIAAEYQRENC